MSGAEDGGRTAVMLMEMVPSNGGASRALVRRTSSLPRGFPRKDLPKYWTSDEVRRVIAAAGNARDQLMMESMWQTGVRVSELRSVTPAAIDFHAGAVQVRTLKRRKEVIRVIPLQGNLLGLLGRHIAGEMIGKEAPLFSLTRQRIHEIVRKAAGKAGLEDERAHPHTFRHSFAVHCVLGGVPVLVLNEWLGHAAIENTLVYTKVLAADSRGFYDGIRFL